jgi:hypothetical protein
MKKALVVNLRNTAYDVDITRATKWGNPYTHEKDKRTLAKHVVATRAEAIAKYEEWVKQQPHLMAALPSLKGKVLGCWCKPLACHGDVLARLANGDDYEEA